MTEFQLDTDPIATAFEVNPPGNPPDETAPNDDADKYLALLNKYDELFQEHRVLREEIAHRRISETLTAAARVLRIPDAVTVYDLPKYAADFIIKDDKVVLAADERQDVVTVLKQLQRDRPHWKPVSRGRSSMDTMQINNTGQPDDWFTLPAEYDERRSL